MPTRIVTIGGGHGTASLTRHLKNQPDVEITAIVAVTDAGGSTEVIRDQYEVIAVGDIRNVIHSLIPEPEVRLKKLIEKRIKTKNNAGFLDNHPSGNLELVLAIKAFNGDIVQAIETVMYKYRAGHRVLPVTADNVQLVAIFDDGTEMEGEGKIDNRLKDNPNDIRKIVDVKLSSKAVILPQTQQAIEQADIIICCGGSPFTSVIPNFCVDGLSQAIRANTRAIFGCVVNLVTNANESPNWKASRHVYELWKRIGRTFDYVFCNEGEMSEKARKAYRAQGARQVIIDQELHGSLPKYAHEIIVDDFLEERVRGAVRHNALLAERVSQLASVLV